MVHLLVSYSVNDAQLTANVNLLQSFFHQLKEKNIPGARYVVYLMGKSCFIHILTAESSQTVESIVTLPAFRQFLSGLDNRIETEPLANNIQEIGTYTAGIFGGR